MAWKAMSQKKASVRRVNPTGLLLTGETGGLAPPLLPRIKRGSTIAPTGATARTATSSGRHRTGTGEEELEERAKPRLNTVSIAEGVTEGWRRMGATSQNTAKFGCTGSYLSTGP